MEPEELLTDLGKHTKIQHLKTQYISLMKIQQLLPGLRTFSSIPTPE